VTLRKFRSISLLLCLVLLAAPLAGCGRKNPLDTPTAGAEKERKRLGEDAPASDSSKPAAGETKTSSFPSPLQKQPSFVLDPLLANR
jgi:predicted small lipoprotein YifL